MFVGKRNQWMKKARNYLATCESHTKRLVDWRLSADLGPGTKGAASIRGPAIHAPSSPRGKQSHVGVVATNLCRAFLNFTQNFHNFASFFTGSLQNVGTFAFSKKSGILCNSSAFC